MFIVAREKRYIRYKVTKLRITADLSSEMMQANEIIFKVLKEVFETKIFSKIKEKVFYTNKNWENSLQAYLHYVLEAHMRAPAMEQGKVNIKYIVFFKLF